VVHFLAKAVAAVLLLMQRPGENYFEIARAGNSLPRKEERPLRRAALEPIIPLPKTICRIIPAKVLADWL
jgi:hypothetical protein